MADCINDKATIGFEEKESVDKAIAQYTKFKSKGSMNVLKNFRGTNRGSKYQEWESVNQHDH